VAINDKIKTDHIDIEFKYRMSGVEEWLIKSIAVEEYFDFSELEEDELLEVDSLTIYDDLIEYIEDERRQVSQIIIIITDKIKNKKRQFNQTFWNDQNNYILERIDHAGAVVDYHEFIIETLLPQKTTGNIENDYEIIRFSPGEEGPKCWLHSIIHDNADGSQSEIRIEPKE
jgi:hypothetical protein